MQVKNKKQIVKEFQDMKPSVAIKQMDFSKFPKEIRDKIKSDLSQVSDDALDLQSNQSTFKKWIEEMTDLYPAVFGIKEDKVAVATPSPAAQGEATSTDSLSELEQKVKDYEVRLKVVKKLIQKPKSDKEGLRARITVINKLIKKTEEQISEAKKAAKKKSVKKKSLGGFLFGALGGFIAGQLIDLDIKKKKVRFDLGGSVEGNKKYKYGITYQLVTPESAENGDFEDTGWEREYAVEELQDILQDAVNRYGIYEPSGSPVHGGVWWSSVSPDTDRDYFEKGHEKYYSLHITNVDGSELTDEEALFVTAKLKEGRNLHWDEEENKWWREGGVVHSADKDGILVFKADTKGGKWTIEVRETTGSYGTGYDILEYKNGSLRGMGSHNNKELLMHKIIDSIIGSKKIDGINYIISVDNIGVKEYLPFSEKIWDIYNSKEFNEWRKTYIDSMPEEQRKAMAEEIKNKAVKYVKDNGYREDDSTIGTFFQLFRKEKLLKDFHQSKGLVMLNEGGSFGNENAQMVMNQNHQIKHHTEELSNVVDEKTHVPAWVVSKVSDAANDLSDATHYLDGEKNKMANGGGFKVNKKYTHFAVSKKTGKIVNGWETISDVESLKYYAKTDLEDMDLNPKDYSILSKETLIRRGINPFDWDNWKSNNELKKGGGVSNRGSYEEIQKIKDYVGYNYNQGDSRGFDIEYDKKKKQYKFYAHNIDAFTVEHFGVEEDVESNYEELRNKIEKDINSKYSNGGGVGSSLYKIKFDGASGEGLYFVTEANSADEAKDKFHNEMLGTDKIKSAPEKTTMKFVGKLPKRNGNHWVIKVDDKRSGGDFGYSAKSFQLTKEEYNYLLPVLKNKLTQSGDRYYFISNNLEDLTDMLNRLKGLYDNYDELKNMVSYKCSMEGSLEPFRKSMGNLKTENQKYSKGGGVSDTPKVYIADLAAYNEGKLIGEWLDLSDFSSGAEVMEKIEELLEQWSKEQGEDREEYAVHDMENFPKDMYSDSMGEDSFQEVIDYWEAITNSDYPMEVVEEYMAQKNEDNAVDAISNMDSAYQGKYSSKSDFAEQLINDIGMPSNPSDYAYVSDTDRRIIAGEQADADLEDMDDDDILERAEMKDEADEYAAKESEIESLEEEIDSLDEEDDADEIKEKQSQLEELKDELDEMDDADKILSKAKAKIHDEIYEEWYDGLEDPYHFLVKEQGLYDDESFMKQSFIGFDYDKFAEDLEQDYTMIEHDGEVYVFSDNYKKGGAVKKKKIGFEGLAKKVAKRYVGKGVKGKYQKEYGKRYDKEEAMEVGNKVAATVFRSQQARKRK